MQVRNLVGCATVALVSTVLVPGCATRDSQLATVGGNSVLAPFGGNSVAQPNGMRSTNPLALTRASAGYPSWMRFSSGAGTDTTATAHIFVSQFYTGYINGYKLYNKANGAPVCKVVGVQNVNGIGADTHGRLYVPQEIWNGTVWTGKITVYKSNCGPLVKTLSAPGPMLDVAVDGSTVYGVGNGNWNWNIQVYAKGATAPTGTLSSPGDVFGIGINSHHDIR